MKDSPAAVLSNLAGNPVRVADVAVGGTSRYLGVAAVQDVILSSNNSTTANLAAGASFTGTADITLAFGAVQVAVFADQPLRVYVQQGADGSNWDVEDTYDLGASAGDGRTVQLVSSYVRVIVENVGHDTTTDLRVQTLLAPAIEALPRSLTENGSLKLSMRRTGFRPDPQSFRSFGDSPSLSQDSEGQLVTRSTSLTDEESFRSNFADGSKYASLTGTAYFRNGSDRVIGSGTNFQSEVKIGQSIKLSTDADADVGTVLDIYSDADILLSAPYAGSTGSGTGSVSDWTYAVGAGGSIAYSGSHVMLNSGTTSGSVVSVSREGDYLPAVMGFRLSVDQRIANQELGVGLLSGTPSAPDRQVTVVMDGTDNTKVRFRTSSSAGITEETLVTLPSGATTASNVSFTLAVLPSHSKLYANRVLVATHEHEIPGPYDPMGLHMWTRNTATAAGSTELSVDYVWFQNFNVLEIGNTAGEPIAVRPERPITPASSNVAAATGSTQLLAANAARLGATVYNDSASALYLKLGSGASSTSFTVKLNKDDYYEVPFGYTGSVFGAWATATGSARVTEVV